MAKTPFHILHIPSEITEHALILSHPRDVAQFAQTCRVARQLVYDPRDQHLWRRLYFAQDFDDLRRSQPDGSSDDAMLFIDWKAELQQRVRATHILYMIDAPRSELLEALHVFLRTFRRVPQQLNKHDQSKDLIWLSRILCDSNIFHRKASGKPQDDESDEAQRLAELWVYVGWRSDPFPTRQSAVEARKHARCFVYDLRNYSRATMWGPFMPDKSGRVNWKHAEMIMKVIWANLQDLNELWADSRPPVSLDATRPYSAPGSSDRDPRDWAGVEGTWRRYVCFMDYRDLFTFNFSVSNNGAYDPNFFDDDDFQEATRLIELKLHITRVDADASTSDDSTPPSSPGSSSHACVPSAPRRPVLHFAGTSRGGNGNEARVRGTVRMTPDGHIRWRFASIYDGHSQWSSEGVQIGHVGSAAGVVGTWTGAHHEEGDPAGPFWLFKVEDDHPSHMHDHHFHD